MIKFEEAMALCGPVVIGRTKQFSRILRIPYEDCLQEARLSLFRKLPNFDPARGKLAGFVDNCVRRRLCAMKREDFSEEIGEEIGGDDRRFEDFELANQLRLFSMRVINSLDDETYLVWKSYVSPDDALLEAIGEGDITIDALAAHLSTSRDSVRHTISKLKHKLTLLLDTPEFSNLVDSHRAQHRWPIVHYVSGHSVDFVSKTLASRSLGGPCSPSHSQGQHSIRTLDVYAWGGVMFLTCGPREATVIFEGKFRDDRDGRVSGIDGYWRSIADSIPWYRSLHKDLS